MKIAIIGTGISGLSASYLLNRSHDITVYEKNDYIGGHSRTIHISVDGKSIPVDTGFIVYNKRNYPLLVRLFDALRVPVLKSDMSFGVSIKKGWLEYGSKNMLSQLTNLFRPKFWGMILDIIKFNNSAYKNPESYEGKNLGEYLDFLNLGDWFRHYYLQAMGAAIWSCPVETILLFPAKSFVTFFKNHGLLTVNDHPQWYTVEGGSREYVSRLSESFKDKIKFNCPVQSVFRKDGKVYVSDKLNNVLEYDHVIFACHADEALKMIDDKSNDEQDILGVFQYQSNRVVVHTDTNFMPKRRGAWASWVYLSEDSIDKKPVVSLSYWMNNLQKLQTETPVIVTLNPGIEPNQSKILDEHYFMHPIFTNKTYMAQEKIDSIQGINQYWFCGAYQRYGFHEDGLLSAVNMVKKMGVDVSWTI